MKPTNVTVTSNRSESLSVPLVALVSREAIKALVTSMWPLDGLTCAIAAPTGLAAFNVGGVTIHRLFQLPIEHEGKAAGYWSLPKASQKVMKTTLRHVKISMVSSLTLASQGFHGLCKQVHSARTHAHSLPV